MASSLSRLLLYSFQFILFYYVQCTVFKDGEKVTLYVNKVGPYWNPHETYHYFTMPLCRPDKVEHKSLTLGEVLDGDRMAISTYDIEFKTDIESKELCKKPITESDLHKLTHAIEDLYYFEFVMDDLPMRGFIGHLDESGFLPHSHQMFLYTHHHFTIEYNGNQVVSVNITTQERTPVNLLEIKPPVDIVFTYSVKWLLTSVKYEDRGKLQQRSSFFPKALEIHWLSVINSVVLVFLLMGFVVIILTRILNRDFRSFSIHDDEADRFEEDDEIGWKVIHTDVFRYPSYKLLLCAIIGVGTQFLTLLGGILSMALCGVFNVHRHGAINAAAILLYALTSCISGYLSARLYRQMEGQRWVWNINLTACLFTVPFFMTWSVINSVAWAWGSTQALPFTTIVILMLIWLCVGYPLTVIGGIFGKNWAGNFNAPCRTKNIAREIPPLPIYRSQFAYMLVGGFLPFSAISVELYYIFATLWGRQSYTLFGILMLVFIILLSVTACVSVALTYFQLSSEDHRWWWRSVISSGSTGLFVFAYALFYYFDRSNMSGILQSLQFFGYTVLTCYVFFLMLGTVGFVASLKFVRYIYVYIKTD